MAIIGKSVLNGWRMLLSLSLSMAALAASAHDARPVYIDIQETFDGLFSVRWKAPVSLQSEALPLLQLPESCEASRLPTSGRTADAYTMTAIYQCNDGLSGQTLALHYPANNPGLNTLFRLSLLNGEQHTKILKPGEQQWQVPLQENFWQVSQQYTALGMKHIFFGIDHLLFVTCLLFIARSARRIVITITGFTLAHSLTLVLSALELVTLPTPPVEAAIALSILFLAHEIAVNNTRSWTWRYPVAVSICFGLLHGFGFASVLKEIGLPQVELIPALLFFNVGVEIGQLLFILSLLLVVSLVASLLKTDRINLLASPPVSQTGSYIMGSVAGFWLLQRIALF